MEKTISKPNDKKLNTKLLTISFNSDRQCFICGTARGFYIYTSIPFDLCFYRDINTGIRIIEMLCFTNILAFVGDGSNRDYPLNKLVIWDDHQTKAVGELLYQSDVKAIRLNTLKIAVALEKKVYIYNFSSHKISEVFETTENPSGILDMSTAGDLVVACLGRTRGEIHLINYAHDVNVNQISYDTAISCIKLSNNAKLCAVAPENGKIIRLYDTTNGNMVKELRRGIHCANISSISFDDTDKLMGLTSNKGTVHLFSIDLEGNDLNGLKSINKRSKLQFMKWMTNYFDSEWSFAQLKINGKVSKLGFVGDNKIVVVTTNGEYYSASFDTIRGGVCKTLEISKLFNY